MEKKIANMTTGEFARLRHRAKLSSLSNFAQFCKDLSGLAFINRKNGKRLYKYELFVLGYKAKQLLKDNYPDIKIVVKKI